MQVVLAGRGVSVPSPAIHREWQRLLESSVGEAEEWPCFSLPASLVTALVDSLPKDIITNCSLSWVIVSLTKMSMTVQKGGRFRTISEAINELRTCLVDRVFWEKKNKEILSFSVFILPAMLLLSIGRERSFTPIYFNFWMMAEPLSVNCIRGQGRCCSELQESLCRGSAHLGVALLQEAQGQSSVLLSICLGPFTYFLLSCHCWGCRPGTQLLQPFAWSWAQAGLCDTCAERRWEAVRCTWQQKSVHLSQRL